MLKINRLRDCGNQLLYGLPDNADKLATLDVGTQYKHDFCEMKESSDQ